MVLSDFLNFFLLLITSVVNNPLFIILYSLFLFMLILYLIRKILHV